MTTAFVNQTNATISAAASQRDGINADIDRLKGIIDRFHEQVLKVRWGLSSVSDDMPTMEVSFAHVR